MIYGYARVSTQHQDLQAQIDELKKYGCEVIYQEKVSGKTVEERKELNKLLEATKRGDKVVFTKLDRFARSTVDALQIAERLNDKGVNMVVLNFGGMVVDVSTATGKMMLTMFAAVAEFERELMLERQRAGIERAKAAGKYRGRIPKYHEDHKGLKHALHLRETTEMTVNEICEICGISRAAFYRAWRKRKKEQN